MQKIVHIILMLFLEYGCSRMKLVLNICVVLCLMLLFLAFHFVAVIGGSLIGFNQFTWDQGIPVGVSVVAKLSPHGCTKETILIEFRNKLFLYMSCLHMV